MSSTKFFISLLLVALSVHATSAGSRRLLNIPGFEMPPYMTIPTPSLLPPLLPSPTNLPPFTFPGTSPSNPIIPDIPMIIPPPSAITSIP
ncbi:36.4 kDa proline-rich protein-like [Salvia divinorum]|uniref:36.4 kDa proline-rich protein-like n=1 Tax=Salvia divinorum TaxID=28513 RepID=A0ABD1I9P1_SALDI